MSTTSARPRHLVRFAPDFSGPSYRRLMQVEIRHGFYNATGGRCNDFKICPTAATASLLRSFGLLFRSEGAAFFVAGDHNRAEQLRRYVQASKAESGMLPRLTFLLSTENPCFVNFTEMPVRYSASVGCYYFSNGSVQRGSGGELVLNPDFPSELPRVRTGSQFDVRVIAESTRCVTLQDVGGKVVGQQDVIGDERPQNLFVSFSSLPEGAYTVGECTSKCNDCSPANITPRRKVVYTLAAQQPFCMIDLFLSEPTGSDDPALYLLQFQPRETIWNYYVVSNGAPLQDLKIIQEPAPGASGTPATVSFRGPESVSLANGQTASRFVSESPIPLLARSTYNFQLRGQIGFQEVRDGVLMRRLPVASSRQIIPGAADFATAHRGGTSRASPGSALSPPPQNFSDIYVYV